MKNFELFTFASAIVLSACLVSCNPEKTETPVKEPSSTGMEVEKRDGYTIKSFYNEAGNIEAVIMAGDSASFVVVPKEAMARSVKMSDDLYNCLKKCKKADGTYDRDCTLRCPSSLTYQVFYTYKNQ